MRVLIETLISFIAGLSAIGFGGYYLWSKRRPSAPAVCRHKRWSPWKTVKQTPIYLYSEVDEGRGIPDRIDVQMTRECRSCGMPQARTVRGIDATSYK